MCILVVASYNKGRFAPFIVEQVEALQQVGVRVEWLGVTDKGWMGYMRCLPLLKRKIREVSPDVIHAHYGLSCLLANIATRRIPVVSTYHGSDINLSKVRPFSALAMKLSAWNIFVSKRNMVLARSKEGRKCSLIPCGINLPASWKELQHQKVELQTLNQWVSSIFEKGKKHVLFAGAFDNAVKDADLAKLVVGLFDNVQLIELKGYNRNQVNALMYNCDAFLMTSKTEGSPQVIKEALACCCPIVSTNVGDVSERIQGVEGCYIANSRNPKEIAELLSKALAFEGRTSGRQKIIADGLTNEQVAKRLIKIYEGYVSK